MEMIGVLLETVTSMFGCLTDRRIATSAEFCAWSAAIDEAHRKQQELSAALDESFQPIAPLLPKLDN
jgi:hypothetical protein